MANISFTIENTKLPRILAAMKGLYPIPIDKDENPLFTDNQWAKEAVRRLVVRDVARWETFIAKEAATVKPDDSIIT